MSTGKADLRMVVVDVESTGVYNNDRIIEIAAVTVDALGNICEEYDTLVNPQRDIGPTGRRWQVIERNDERQEVLVKPAYGAKPPFFAGGYGEVASKVRERMLSILLGDEQPIFLNETARQMLTKARATARRLGLDSRRTLAEGPDTALFTWTSTRINYTLMLIGQAAGFDVTDFGIGLFFSRVSVDRVMDTYRAAAERGIDSAVLAKLGDQRPREKYDNLVPSGLRARAFMRDRLDVEGARQWLLSLPTAT